MSRFIEIPALTTEVSCEMDVNRQTHGWMTSKHDAFYSLLLADMWTHSVVINIQYVPSICLVTCS